MVSVLLQLGSHCVKSLVFGVQYVSGLDENPECKQENTTIHLSAWHDPCTYFALHALMDKKNLLCCNNFIQRSSRTPIFWNKYDMFTPLHLLPLKSFVTYSYYKASYCHHLQPLHDFMLPLQVRNALKLPVLIKTRFCSTSTVMDVMSFI